MNPSFNAKAEILVEFHFLLLVLLQSLKILSSLTSESGVFKKGDFIIFFGKYPI